MQRVTAPARDKAIIMGSLLNIATPAAQIKYTAAAIGLLLSNVFILVPPFLLFSRNVLSHIDGVYPFHAVTVGELVCCSAHRRRCSVYGIQPARKIAVIKFVDVCNAGNIHQFTAAAALGVYPP